MKSLEKRKPGRPKGSKNKKKALEPKATKGPQPFYILWNPEGSTNPSVTFDNLELAFTTAEEMQSRLGQGSMFIMKAVAVSVVSQNVKSVSLG